MRRKLPRAALLCAALCLQVSFAHAHPRLKRSAPAAGEIVVQPLAEIRMRFGDALIPRYTGLQLSDAYGKFIGTGNLALDPKYNTKLIVPIMSR